MRSPAAATVLGGLAMSVAAFDVAVDIDGPAAVTNVDSLTSVTIDVCLLKQRFDFTNIALLHLTAHLGGGGAILRVGGSDQNNYHYDMRSEAFPDRCCEAGATSCHGCARNCVMTATYWRQVGERSYFLVFVQPFEKYGTSIERNTALIEKVSPCSELCQCDGPSPRLRTRARACECNCVDHILSKIQSVSSCIHLWERD
eukprot:SAG31_NODE_575_length_13961_cov_41.577550_7_plen_200_part_00